MDPILRLKALILGIVEGLTEFLPISSTGHLILAGDLLDFNDDRGKLFEIVIQSGAILAVVWEYRERLLIVARGAFSDKAAQKFILNLFIAFLPLAILGLAYGVMAPELEDLVGSSDSTREILEHFGGSGDLIDVYLAAVVAMGGLGVAAYTVQARLRGFGGRFEADGGCQLARHGRVEGQLQRPDRQAGGLGVLALATELGGKRLAHLVVKALFHRVGHATGRGAADPAHLPLSP